MLEIPDFQSGLAFHNIGRLMESSQLSCHGVEPECLSRLPVYGLCNNHDALLQAWKLCLESNWATRKLPVVSDWTRCRPELHFHRFRTWNFEDRLQRKLTGSRTL